MKLDVSFWLLNANGTYRCPLPDHGRWTLSPIKGQPGAVTLEYPVTGRNFDALREHHDADRDARVAIWIDGRDDGSLRALLVAEDADDIDEQAVWTFTGHFTEVRTEEAVIAPRTEVVVPPGGEAPTEDLAAFRIYSATAGVVMKTLMQEAHAGGELADLGTVTFTGTHDSNGVPWSKVITLKFAPGVSYLKVLEALEEYQLADWAVVGSELELYEYGTRGRDLTLGANPVILRAGRDLTDSPRKRTIRGAITDLILSGAEGLYERVHDATARARRGKVVVGYASAGSILSRDALIAYGTAKLAQQVHGTLEVTHGLALGDDGPVPLLDYGVSDWIWSDTGRPELERLQVAQITIQGDDSGEITGSVSLNDLIASQQAALARRIAGIEGGSTIAGTSQARPVPDTPDTMPPARVETPGVMSLPQPTADSVPRSAVYVDWPDVTTNADNTAIEDLDHYELRYRFLGGSGYPDGWLDPVSAVTDSSASWGGVPSGAAIEVQVRAVDRSGNAGEWSPPASHTTEGDTTPPPTPSAAALESFVTLVAATWDGRSSAPAAMPRRFRYAEVHSSTTSDFTPHRPANIADSTTYDGLLTGAGTLAVQRAVDLTPGTTLYVRLVAVDAWGNASAPSAQVSIVIEPVRDGDVASLSVGKLTAGVLTALMTLSGIIQTAASGSRVRIDTNGLWCYNSAGTEVLAYRIGTGVLKMMGELLAQGTGNAKIHIVPGTQPTMYLGSANGVYGDAFMNAIDTPSLSGTTSLGINSGPTNAGTSAARRGTRAYLRPDAASVEVVNGSQARRGGGMDVSTASASLQFVDANGNLRGDVFMDSGSAFLAMRNTSGDITARVQLYPNGQAFVGGTGNNYVLLGPSGSQLVSNGAVKSFVIDHPDDDERWLVHACTESPVAAVEDAGEVWVPHGGGAATVVLPHYWPGLVVPGTTTVQLTVIDEGQVVLPQAAAGRVRDGRFTVRTDSAWPVRVAWHVRGERRGTRFETEPLRRNYDARGDGPYRYLVPRDPTAWEG